MKELIPGVTILVLLTLAACAPPAPTLTPTILAPSATPTPLASATPRPTATVIPTWTPEPSPTPPPLPTLEARDLLASIDYAAARIEQAAETPIVCMRHEDTDADGEAEWFALTQLAGDPGRMDGYILDGETLYKLEPAMPKPGVADVGLGQFPVCDVFLRDMNLDGQPELGIYGHTVKNETLLHLFVWDKAQETYRRLGYFSGDAGVHVVNVDGDLAEEIWEGYRDRNAPDLAWYVIHTWRDGTYGWTSDRYDWYYRDRPQTYPTHAPEYVVISYYLALGERDMATAYGLFAASQQPEYAEWAVGYATTLKVSVGDAHVIPAESDENNARVTAMVTAWDNDLGAITGRLWNVEWSVVNTSDGWKLVETTSELLDEWPVSFLP